MLTHFTTRLALPLVGGLLFSVITVGYVFDRGRTDALRREEFARISQDTLLAADRLSASLQFLERDVRFLAEVPPIQGIVRSRAAGGVDPAHDTPERLWRQRLAEIFRAYLQAHPEQFQLRYIGAADGGRELVRVERRGGQIVTVPAEALQQKGNRDYFRAVTALPVGAVRISEFDLNREHGQVQTPPIRTLRLGTPVHDAAGALFGMVVVNVDIGLTLDALGRGLPAGVETYVVNERGDYLLHPRPDMSFGFDLGRPHRIQETFPELGPLLARPTEAGEEQVVHLRAGDDLLLHAYRLHFDPARPERFVAVVLAAPYSGLVQESAAALTRNLVISGALVALALGLVALLARAYNQPMRKLGLAAARITDGDYEVELPRSKDRAVQVLSDAFRRMVETVREREQQLRQLNQELEQRVERRTAALSASEQQLRGQQRLLQLIIDHIDDGVVVVDRDGRHLLTNPAAGRFLDPASLDAPPAEWAQRWGLQKAQGETVRPPLLDALTGERVGGATFQLRNPHGDDRWANASASPLLDDAGELQGAVMTLHDITERHRLEEQWRLVAAVFEHSIEGIMIVNRERQIIHINRAFTTITGYTEGETLGRNPSMLSSGWQDAAFYQSFWQSIREQGNWQGELTNRRKDGELYDEWLNVFKVKDADGAVQNYVGMFYDITERKEAERHIHRLAFFDALTQLPNRRLFQDRVDHALHYAHRHGASVAILFIDLDRFKPVNDSLGHRAGDLLLQQVARRLAEQVRESDTVARLGGDEFGIVAQDAGQREAQLLAERIRGALQAPVELEGQEVFVSASVGVSLYPDDGKDLHTLLKHADIAMYLAKKRGRGAYQFYMDSMNQGLAERLRLENDLHRALEREEFELHYQPQFELDSGELVGVEALIRWHHPERGLLLPGGFIALAEESGLIDPITDWVMREACRQHRLWLRDGLPPIRIAVNLSARSFNDDIRGKVERLLGETGMAAEFLELELTESMLMTDPERVSTVLAELSALGVVLAIDDFGTGYSSLSYLKRFPIHRLKVDRSFINGLPDDPEDAAITGSIIAMAHNLQLRVIAEGVERPEQVAFLRERGCHEVQGYLYGRPRPADQLRSWLRGPRESSVPAA